MQQIYVVVSQENSLDGTACIPVAAYGDYPSALAFAQSIFKSTFDPGVTARDLVFMVNLTTTPTTPSSTPAVATK